MQVDVLHRFAVPLTHICFLFVSLLNCMHFMECFHLSPPPLPLTPATTPSYDPIHPLSLPASAPIPMAGFLCCDAGITQVPQLQPGSQASVHIPLIPFQNVSAPPPSPLLQVAVKNGQQPVWYFNDAMPLQAFFTEEGQMERGAFLEVRLSP